MFQNLFFDETKWRKVVAGRYDWYRVLYPEFDAILAKYECADLNTRKEARNAVYGFFEPLLGVGKVLLGAVGKDWDAERKLVDTVVIHHTKGESGITWQRLDAMHLLRLYAKSYLSPTTEKEIEGLPVWSNHFRNENGEKRMVFYAYHWLVHADGTAERLLNDNEIGWQAGDWDINCRSVGVCLDGDFEHSAPPDAMIEGARKIIDEHYAHVAGKRIIPHRQVNQKTTCPGEWFDGVLWANASRREFRSSASNA